MRLLLGYHSLEVWPEMALHQREGRVRGLNHGGAVRAGRAGRERTVK